MRPGRVLGQFGIEQTSPVVRISSRHRQPMVAPPRKLQGRGRFDDPMINAEAVQPGYSVLYAATEPHAAYLEVLYRYRAPLKRLVEIANELVLDTHERDQLVESSGKLPADWLTHSVETRATLVLRAPIFDLTNSAAVQSVRELFALQILGMGIDDLDFGTVLGGNRQFTQMLSRWLWTMTTDSGEPLFSGIRYRSRFDPECICLALYEDRYAVDGDIEIQLISSETPGFAEAANTLRLEIA